MENPYDWSNEDLVKNFMNACARAGVSTSGLCFDIMAGSNLSEAHFLKGVLLARLEGIKPPFKPGDKVRSKKTMVMPLPGGNYGCTYYSSRQLPETLVVRQIFYKGNGQWNLTFSGKDPATTYVDSWFDQDGSGSNTILLVFQAADFELVTIETLVAS